MILTKTVKGYGMGLAGEGQNTTHSQKKMGTEALAAVANRVTIPVTESQLEKAEYYKPAADSEEMKYLHERRQALGGSTGGGNSSNSSGSQ